MTRKRYVKLLMSMGYSRNTANAMAQKVQVMGKTYQKTYDGVVALQELYEALIGTVEPIVDGFKRMARAFSTGVEAFGAKFREEFARE